MVPFLDYTPSFYLMVLILTVCLLLAMLELRRLLYCRPRMTTGEVDGITLATAGPAPLRAPLPVAGSKGEIDVRHLVVTLPPGGA